jgi:hypothetical protein
MDDRTDMAEVEPTRTFAETYPGLTSWYSLDRHDHEPPANFARFMNLLAARDLGTVAVQRGDESSRYTVSPDSNRNALVLASELRGGSGGRILAAARIIFY